MKPKIEILGHCSACGACVEICPVLCLRLADSTVEVVSEADCLGCRHCEDVCPADAIRITGVVP